MNIGVLTSSRADFGIYLPLLKALNAQPWANTKIIAFGTHLSHFHGHTIDQIEEAGFKVSYTVESMLLTDSAQSISTAAGLTVIQFSTFWKEHAHEFDLVFCLGDRYEMFAAVMAGVSFQVKFAHLHGGEVTLGAIDNVFRHAITQASSIHFTSTQQAAERVAQMLDVPENIHWVGALSLDNIFSIDLLTREQFMHKWGVDFSKPTILTTYHPETVNQNNVDQAKELINAVEILSDKYQFLITMPNADTQGNELRELMIQRLNGNSNVHMFENLGTQSYFTAMANCKLLLGNTSSGIIEAASFGKYVINLGDRQKGRLYGPNVLSVPVDKDAILKTVEAIEGSAELTNTNIYYNGGATNAIIDVITNFAD